MPRRRPDASFPFWSSAGLFFRRGLTPESRRRRRTTSSESWVRPAEILELRTLLSAVDLAPAVAPMWFQAAIDANGGKQSLQSDPAPAAQDWVVQLQVDTASQ